MRLSILLLYQIRKIKKCLYYNRIFNVNCETLKIREQILRRVEQK